MQPSALDSVRIQIRRFSQKLVASFRRSESLRVADGTEEAVDEWWIVDLDAANRWKDGFG
jgi:hypothetical protein